MKNTLLILMCFILSACGMNAARLHFAEENYQNHNYERSMRLLVYPAKHGDPDAQYAIAYMYFYGQGVVENKEIAKRWFELAAAQGHKQAQEALAMINRHSS